MAVEVSVSAEVDTVEVKQVVTNRSRVRAVAFNFDRSQCLAVIAFGTGEQENFIEKAREHWLLRGDFYLNAVSGAPVGDSSAEVLFNGIGGVVQAIQQTEGLKASLLASGELEMADAFAAMRLFD